jgi:hypothetical protein
MVLASTDWARARVDTIRLKLFKIGALIRISVRRISSNSVPFIPGKVSTFRFFTLCAVDPDSQILANYYFFSSAPFQALALLRSKILKTLYLPTFTGSIPPPTALLPM